MAYINVLQGTFVFLTVDGTPVRGPGPLGLIQYIHEYNSFVSYSHRAVHLCPIFSQGKIYVRPILIGLFICGLFSQGKIMCPILTGLFICVLFSQGSSFVSYSHRDEQMCPILTGMESACWASTWASAYGPLHGRLHGRLAAGSMPYGILLGAILARSWGHLG